MPENVLYVHMRRAWPRRHVKESFGVRLTEAPATGAVLVLSVAPGSAAAAAGGPRVGDRLLLLSVVVGDVGGHVTDISCEAGGTAVSLASSSIS
eukprot:COSAG05_NODE_8285_length_718_cov_1.114701_1_plen_94_part_00